MMYHAALWIRTFAPFFNVIHYVSFRVMAALLTSLSLSLIFGPWFIALSGKFFRSKVRAYTPESHQIKNDMPICWNSLHKHDQHAAPA